MWRANKISLSKRMLLDFFLSLSLYLDRTITDIGYVALVDRQRSSNSSTNSYGETEPEIR